MYTHARFTAPRPPPLYIARIPATKDGRFREKGAYAAASIPPPEKRQTTPWGKDTLAFLARPGVTGQGKVFIFVIILF